MRSSIKFSSSQRQVPRRRVRPRQVPLQRVPPRRLPSAQADWLSYRVAVVTVRYQWGGLFSDGIQRSTMVVILTGIFVVVVLRWLFCRVKMD